MSLSRRALLQQGAAYALTAGLAAPVALNAAEPAAAAKVAKPAAKPKADPYADAVFADGEPPLPADGSFTVVVLPDVQNYSEKFPEQFHAQTEWIAANVKPRKIAAVLQLGDVTNHNVPAEWEVAQAAMSKLDGVVPYFMTLGNHDYSERGGCSDRTTLYNDYFPIAKARTSPHFGGTYDREPERMENCFHTFAAGGRKFLVLSLEFGPRADVVRWANEVAAKHADHEAILITHAYMYYDETRYDWKKYGPDQRWNPHGYKVAANTKDDVHDGQQLWEALVGKQENFILTLNGHVIGDGLGRTVTKTPKGRDVHQVLVNFQMKPNGGDGWLRLLEFKADGTTIAACDFSPTLRRQNVSKQNKFDMTTAKPATA
jgi:hypothetical protein